MDNRQHNNSDSFMNTETADNTPNPEKNDLIEANPKKVTWSSIAYDGVMLFIICVDLLIIVVDAIMMSGLTQNIVTYLTSYLGFNWLSDALYHYRANWHPTATWLGDGITIFLIAEVAFRWFWAIVTQRYYRWFFFPFVHWYEVISCFPQFRALRLLRVVVIGYRLYQMGFNVIRKSWIKTGKFYYNMVLEEISDRVIMIALGTIENELKNSNAHQKLIRSIIDNNRPQIQSLVGEILQKEVAPNLKQNADLTREGVGNAVYRALANVPELNKYLRMIPIAGKMIESEIQSIGKSVADNIASELLQPFYQDAKHGKQTNENFEIISKAVGNISAKHEPLEELVSSIIFSSIDTIRAQIKDQQWRDTQASSLDIPEDKDA